MVPMMKILAKTLAKQVKPSFKDIQIMSPETLEYLSPETYADISNDLAWESKDPDWHVAEVEDLLSDALLGQLQIGSTGELGMFNIKCMKKVI